MTAAQVITARARYILDDTDAGEEERWGDAILLAWLNDGQRLIAEVRPEALLTAPYTQATFAEATTYSATLILPDRYLSSLVSYVCAQAFAQESQDERDMTRARSQFTQFVIKAGLPSNHPTIKGRRP